MGRKIKMIMTDLDGTLLNSRHQVTKEGHDALLRASEEGIRIVPVTARFFRLAGKVLNDLEMADYVVCCNGAALYDTKTGECVFREEVDKETVMKILDYCDGIRCVQYAAINGVCYLDKTSFEKYYYTMKVPALYERAEDPSELLDIRTIIERPDSHVELIYLLFPDVESKAEADEAINRMGDVFTLGAFPTEMEISNASANKENIILNMKNILGVDASEIMAFGDGDNDSGMVKNAGIGVAMENAMEKTKKAAKYITKSNDESGVAYMINKYLDGDLE